MQDSLRGNNCERFYTGLECHGYVVICIVTLTMDTAFGLMHNQNISAQCYKITKKCLIWVFTFTFAFGLATKLNKEKNQVLSHCLEIMKKVSFFMLQFFFVLVIFQMFEFSRENFWFFSWKFKYLLEWFVWIFARKNQQFCSFSVEIQIHFGMICMNFHAKNTKTTSSI